MDTMNGLEPCSYYFGSADEDGAAAYASIIRLAATLDCFLPKETQAKLARSLRRAAQTVSPEELGHKLFLVLAEGLEAEAEGR